MRWPKWAFPTVAGRRVTTAACTGYGVEHVVASAVPPAGGSQGTGQNVTSDLGAVPVRLGTPVRAGVGVSS